MGLYKRKYNPVPNTSLVPTAVIVSFKEAVVNAAALPLIGNAISDGRITNDTGHLYIWDGTSWIDQGNIIDVTWASIEDKPLSSVSNIDDAVSKKHSQGTDQGLDTGGPNAVTASQAKSGYSHSQSAHAPSDAVSLATVKGDTDISDAISKKHSQNTDTILSQGNANEISASSIKTNFDILFMNIALTMFRLANHATLTIQKMVNGIVDEFEDENGIDTVNSINEIYDSVDDFYKPSGIVDSSVKFLSHFNGTDGQTSATDISQSGRTITFGGTAQLDTDYPKFGTSALLLDGNSDWVSIPSSTDFDFGSNDFTVEFFIRPKLITATEMIITLNPDTDIDVSGSAGFICFIKNDGSIGVGMSSAGNSWDIVYSNPLTDPGVLVADVYKHVAIVRNGSNMLCFVNGALEGTVALNTGNMTPTSGGRANLIGRFSHQMFYEGHLDSVQIRTGARYTTTFSPPTSEDEGLPQNMTLYSETNVAEDVPSDGRIILFEEDIDSITENTDLKAYISRDNGTTYTQVTLVDEGGYDSSRRVLAGTVDISSQPSGSNMKYKITTHNNKSLKLHGISLFWK